MSADEFGTAFMKKRRELLEHVDVWRLFYAKVFIKVMIAVLPVFLVEFANYHNTSDIEQMTWIVLCLNGLLQAVNVINSMMDSTFKSITDQQEASAKANPSPTPPTQVQ